MLLSSACGILRLVLVLVNVFFCFCWCRLSLFYFCFVAALVAMDLLFESVSFCGIFSDLLLLFFWY